MDERAERQLRWLEEATDRVATEAKTLAEQVEDGEELIEHLLQTAYALHYEVEAVKGKLRLKPEKVEEGVEEEKGELLIDQVGPIQIADLIAEKEAKEPGKSETAKVEPVQPKPKRREQHGRR